MGGDPSTRLKEHLLSQLLGRVSSCNMSTEKGPNLFSNCRNTSRLSFQLLESVLCRDSHSPRTFSTPGSEVICLQAESNVDSSSFGQYYSNRFPEQNGWYPFTSTLNTGCGDLELVHRKELDYPCRAPSRKAASSSR